MRVRDDRTLMDEDNARFSAFLATICGLGIVAICVAAAIFRWWYA